MRRFLDNNQLSGSLPASLGSMTALSRLCDQLACTASGCGFARWTDTRGVVLRRYLYNNQLSGTLPASLGSLTALQEMCDRREQLACKACGRGFALWTDGALLCCAGSSTTTSSAARCPPRWEACRRFNICAITASSLRARQAGAALHLPWTDAHDVVCRQVA